MPARLLLAAAGAGIGTALLLGLPARVPRSARAPRPTLAPTISAGGMPAPVPDAPEEGATRSSVDARARDDTAGAARAGPRAVRSAVVLGQSRRFLAALAGWEAGRRGAFGELRGTADTRVLRRLARGPPPPPGHGVPPVPVALRAYRERGGWTVVAELRPRITAAAIELRLARRAGGGIEVVRFVP